MFDVGTKIVYGNNGVYEVRQIAPSPVDKTDTRKFYMLVPLYESSSNIIFTPVDNDRVKIRKLISQQEAEELILRIPYIKPLEVPNDKARRNMYKDAMNQAELDVYVEVIKSVYTRRAELLKNKKRISDSDADVEKRAKFCLYSEIASVYDIQLSEVENFISEKINSAV